MIVKHSKAFSMLTAIVVIVAMSVIAAYVTSTAGKSIKNTTDQYRKAQAALYAKSYTEYAIMAVGAADGDCIEDINAVLGTAQATRGMGDADAQRPGYDVELRLSYIGQGGILAQCADNRVFSNVAGISSPLNIIVDVYVKYRDLNDMNTILTYHRRSLQKI